MTDLRDPIALVRHAIQVGDWQLVELLAHALSRHTGARLPLAHRVYCSLVLRLGLDGL